MLRSACLAMSLVLCPVSLAQAQTLTPNDMRAAAIRAVGVGDARAALTLTDALLARDAGDSVALNVRSRALRNLGQYAAAEKAGRQAWSIADTPAEKFSAATLVAQALASDGKKTRAQFWLRRAAHNAPSENRRRQAIRDFRYVQASNPLQTSLSFNISPTSNANNGSTTDTFNWFGLPLTLNGTARALSGVQYSASGAFRYRLKESATAKTDLTLSLQHQTYSLSSEAKSIAPDAKGSDFAFTAAQLTLGREWITGRGAKKRFTGTRLTLGKNWYGGDALTDYARIGAYTRFQVSPTSIAQVGLDLETQKRHDGGGDTANAVALDGTLYRTLANGARVSFGGNLRRSVSDRDDLDFTFGSVVASYQLPKPVLGAFVTLRGELAVREFDDSPYTIDGRRDVTKGLGLELFFAETDFYGFAPTVSLNGNTRDSDVDLYDTRNLGVEVGFRSVF
ncbi:hypothetical protein [Oceaniglobus indicus]|uniref:hypothetical protein n=1 Tax=Oceaniglobus indicus TaxID=2047749 RepID=UPI000C1850E8|nr:hypothetical protein [Oceaniglobus indicus]